MGAKQSSNPPRVKTFSGSTPGASHIGSHGAGELAIGGASGSGNSRTRARSLVSFSKGPSNSLQIPSTNGGPLGLVHGAGSPDSESSPDDGSFAIGGRTFNHSLPVHLFAVHVGEYVYELPYKRYSGFTCRMCSKCIPPDDIECHLVMCLTKPRITYNEDVLHEDKGECAICLDDLQQGDTIARLPCLCIYHQGCIHKWFEVNRSCPVHPAD
jgi:E3 ubiquitin-protein ligase ZNRF1/2